ncbi:hypothetical protein [Saccharospirillum impatiens]|uniref:hypothetical protein n=1 Tax=Saccharospirillum impatiens TaxID=169438 RepID=UPI0003F7C4D4|nr:hypothetical protein [Saccharospirillum impatiens]
MIGDLLLPTILMPLLVMLAAAVASLRVAWAPLVGSLVAILGAYGWIQGFRFSQPLNPTAMDGLWLMTLVAVLAASVNRWRGAAFILLGLPISVWVVWVFAASIGPIAWLGQVVALLVPVALVAYSAESRDDPAEVTRGFWMSGFLVAPVAILAPTVGLAGSIKLAEIAGAMGVVMAACWWVNCAAPMISGWSVSRLWQRLLVTLTLPLMWVALTAYHLVDVPVLALLAAALPWLTVSLFRAWLSTRRWWLQLAVLVAVTALPLVFSLWYVWPEQSMY